jgi:hypothetical protein
VNRSQWLKKYPNHCRRCEGHTDSAMPCRDCLLNYLTCPRCGNRETLHPEDATVPCTKCGWVEGADMGAPLSREQKREQARFERENADRQRDAALRRHKEAIEGLGYDVSLSRRRP